MTAATASVGRLDLRRIAVSIAAPALECPSRTCLHFPQDEGATPPMGAQYADMCTAECSGDDDCDKVSESPCVSGFTCAVPVVVGPFCCRKMCICRDFLIIPDGGVPEPEQPAAQPSSALPPPTPVGGTAEPGGGDGPDGRGFLVAGILALVVVLAFAFAEGAANDWIGVAVIDNAITSFDSVWLLRL